MLRFVFAAVFVMPLAGCIGTAVSVTKDVVVGTASLATDVVVGTVDITTDVVGTTVDIVTPDFGDDEDAQDG